VQALVGGELRGRISWDGAPGGGTRVTVGVTLRRVPEAPADAQNGSTG
jgi:hypothetical protein